MDTLSDLDIAISLAFRMFLEKTKDTHKNVALRVGISGSAVSKILTFRQKLSFEQVHIFCKEYGFCISEISKLVDKISQDQIITEAVRNYLRTKKQVKFPVMSVLD